MKRFALPLLAVLYLPFGCQSESAAPEAPTSPEMEELAGIWRRVEIAVFEEVDGNIQEILVPKEDFYEKLGIVTDVATYNRDSSYTGYFIGENDSILSRTSGRWWISGDSLFLHQLSPGESHSVAQFEVQNDTITLKEFVAWGDEGEDAVVIAKAVREAEELTEYVMVFLYAGDRISDISPRELQDLQQSHLATTRRLIAEKKLILAGPFMDKDELWGIYVLDVQTVEEAAAILDSDPSIQAGRFRAEYRTWYGPASLRKAMQ